MISREVDVYRDIEDFPEIIKKDYLTFQLSNINSGDSAKIMIRFIY